MVIGGAGYKIVRGMKNDDNEQIFEGYKQAVGGLIEMNDGALNFSFGMLLGGLIGGYVGYKAAKMDEESKHDDCHDDACEECEDDN